MTSLFSWTPPSSRRIVTIKGYQTWAGRSLFALSALRMCREALQGYEINVIPACPDVKLAVDLLRIETGLNIRSATRLSHADNIRMLGQARINVSASISDGMPMTMLECMAIGTFPIQSHTSCASEWVKDGSSAILIPPEDPPAIASAIERALKDDALVDNAATINRDIIQNRLAANKIREQVIDIYQRILQGQTVPRADEQSPCPCSGSS
jgi:glycosyltransferase involved in cell wall biosynthesis